MAEEVGKMSNEKHRNIIETSIVGVAEDTIKKIIARYDCIWETIAD